MILLDIGNRILGETVAAQIKWAPASFEEGEKKKKKQREPCDVRLWDFDDVEYRVQILPENPSEMLVSMSLPCFAEIEEVAGRAYLEKLYEGYVDTPGEGFNIGLKIDLDSLTDEKAKDQMIEKLQNLKPNIVGSVFDHYFQQCLDEKKSEPFKFDLRPDTTVYFFPGDDRVTVVFGLDFSDKVDKVLARVFVQEFVDARRQLRQAPPCSFGEVPPRELHHFDIKEPTGNLGFLSFAVLRGNLVKGRKDGVVRVMQTFRNYLQYHIKCSKSFFHSRMRARVESLLKVLNRAKVQKEEKALKTASGKTFKRQA